MVFFFNLHTFAYQGMQIISGFVINNILKARFSEINKNGIVEGIYRIDHVGNNVDSLPSIFGWPTTSGYPCLDIFEKEENQGYFRHGL